MAKRNFKWKMGGFLSLILWVRDDEDFDLQLLLIQIVCMNTHNQTLSVQRLSDVDYRKTLAIQLFSSSATIF